MPRKRKTPKEPTYFGTGTDPVTGEVVKVRHYGTEEIAELTHRSVEVVRAKCRSGEWNHFIGKGREYYMTAEDIADALALDRHEREPERQPVKLGVLVDPDDLEDVR